MYSAAFFLFWFGNDWKNMTFGLEMHKKYRFFGLEMNKKYAIFGLEMHKKYCFFGLEMKIKLYFINQQSSTSMEDEVLLRWSVKLY